MMSDKLRALEVEISQFRAWADAYSPANRHGEWELDYQDWPRLYTTFSAFVASASCAHWSHATIDLILYAIARDNEIGHLLQEVRKNPDDFLCLAEHATLSTEMYAKTQFALELGRMGLRSPQVESLLLRLARDDDEYVRRLAISALADIGSPYAVDLAQAAWETGIEHQRMMVLYVLWKARSPLLERYVSLAQIDGRPYLLDYVTQVRQGHPG